MNVGVGNVGADVDARTATLMDVAMDKDKAQLQEVQDLIGQLNAKDEIIVNLWKAIDEMRLKAERKNETINKQRE